MSLIYKSLQHVAREDGRGRASAAMPRHAPGSVALTKRFAIFLTVLMAASAASAGLIWWLRGELERIGPRMDVHYQQPDDTPEAAPATVNATPAPAPEQAPTITAMPRLSTPAKIAPTVQTRIGIEDLAKPTLELEQLFAQRAKRNQRIMDLDRQLTAAWTHDDMIRVSALLTDLRRTAGAEAALPRKWDGALALRQKHFARAEEIFSVLVKERRNDATARINLVQALLGQGKRDQARTEQDRLQRDFPDNAKVRELGQAFP